MSGRRRHGNGTAPLGIQAVCALVGLAVLFGVIFGLHYLIEGTFRGTGTHDVVLGGVLLGLALLQGLVAYGLLKLKPAAWYGGVGLFGAATAVSLYVFIIEVSLPSLALLTLNGIVTLYVYYKRPVYTPGTQARYDALRSESPIDQFAFVQRMRESDAAPLGMKLLVVVGTLASLIAFFQGVRLLWMMGTAVTLLGLLVIALSLVQGYVLYGLWLVERWAWFAGLLLFGLATVFAVFRIFVFTDPIAIIEFVVNGLITLYIYRQKPLYAPRVVIDLTPR